MDAARNLLLTNILSAVGRAIALNENIPYSNGLEKAHTKMQSNKKFCDMVTAFVNSIEI